MPELPDITVYVEALQRRVVGETLEAVRVQSASLLKTFDPPIGSTAGKRVVSAGRIGKRLVFGLEDELFLVLHLMIAGRLKWRKRGAKIPRKGAHAAFDFADGTILLTEASTKKRASLHVVRGEDALVPFRRGGLDVFAIDGAAFAERLTSENHTLKRALTDPRLFDGIGNAYSDEILHAAQLSPVQLTRNLDASEIERLYTACRDTLTAWTNRLRDEVGDGFPEKVTAFREGMAVHGRYREPCPVCDAPVQRIQYSQREINYCAGCQTGGRLLADRTLSRLLKDDWPKRLEDLERPGG